MNQWELARIAEAEAQIGTYTAMLIKQLRASVEEFQAQNPNHEFDHLDIKYDAEKNIYSIQPIFKKVQ